MFLDDAVFVGQKLKEYRKKSGLSQEELEERANLAIKHYGRIERGQCLPSLSTFIKLIQILNIPLSEFGFCEEIQENKEKNNLLREIYLLNSSEIQACINFIKIIKNLKKQQFNE